jgi:hypothetical protein
VIFTKLEERVMRNNRPSIINGTRAELKIKTIAISLVASTSLLIAAVLNASMSLSSPSFLISSSPLPTASAQMDAQDGRTGSLLSSSSTSTSTTSSSSSSSSTSIPESTSHDFRFSYTKLGISNGSYQRILYDSETNSRRLNNVSSAINKNESGRLSLYQGQFQSQSNKQISDSSQKNLQKMVEQNGFFQTNSIYAPPDTGSNENYDTLYALSIEMDNKAHTVIWTDASENIPTTILSIVKAIEKIIS